MEARAYQSKESALDLKKNNNIMTEPLPSSSGSAAAFLSWPCRIADTTEDRALYFGNLQKWVAPEIRGRMPTGLRASTLLELMTIRSYHSKLLRHFRFGTAVGFRIKKGVLTDIPAILVFVRRKVHRKWLSPNECLPIALEGPGGVWCDLDVVEFAYFGAPTAMPKEQVYTELVDGFGGSEASIGSGSQVASQKTYGTLGAIVRSRTGNGQVGFVTNRHVAVDLDYPSQKMFHPLSPSLGLGVYLGAVERAMSFVTDDLWYGIFVGTNPETFVRADGAFIPFDEDFDMENLTTLVKGVGEIGDVHIIDLQSTIDCLVGRQVVKVGRSSGLTTGTIMAYSLEYNDENGISLYTDFLVVGENQETFDLEGDSGSLILLTSQNVGDLPRPVGIIWGGTANRGWLKLKAGQPPENWTSGVDLGRLLDVLELDLITSTQGLQDALRDRRNESLAQTDSTVAESSPQEQDIEIQIKGMDFATRHILEATSVSQNVREKETPIHYEDPETRVLRSRAKGQENEIMYLKEQIVLTNTRQMQALNEKYALEREFSELQMALDEKQTEVITFVLNELARRKGDLEVKLKLQNELKIVNDEKQVFASATLGILAKYGGAIPCHTNASALSNSIKHLRAALLSRMRTSHARLAAMLDEGPGIENLQIIGEAKPGCKLLACGYPVRGTSLCMFQWVRQYPDGTKQYIEGASKPDYILTAEDVDKLIAVECIPMDEQGMQGELVRIFANDHNKIKCVDMMHDGDVAMLDEVPGIEDLQIIGEAKLGCKLIACGYPVRGTSLCIFQWVRQYPDGTKQYIEGATNPDYILSAEDVDKLIAVECIPMDEQGRQGEIVRIFANDHNKIKCASFVLHHETSRSELGNDSFERASFTVRDITSTPIDLPIDSISAPSTLKICDEKGTPAETETTDEVMTQAAFTTKPSMMLDYFDLDAPAKEKSESTSESGEESESIIKFHVAVPKSLNLTHGEQIESASPIECIHASSIYDTLSSIHHKSTTLHDESITITISTTGKLHAYADLELIILHASLRELQRANRDIGDLDLDYHPKNNDYLFLVKKQQLLFDQRSIIASNQSFASLLGCQLSSVLPPHFLIHERFATEEEWGQACVVILTESGHLMNSLTGGPYRCPDLAVLFLLGEHTLSHISSSFFNFMPALSFLDLSGTRSRTLPSSLFTLTRLQVLLLRNCPRLVKIPTEIENLHHLQVLDLSGTTELHDLPGQVGKLTNLKEFQVSLYGPDDESEHIYLPSELLSGVSLSKLQELEALSIVVHPEDHRWRKMASDVTQEIIELKNLRHLQFYFPEIKNLETFIKKNPSWDTLRTFKLVVGHDVKRIAPRVPDEVEFKYDQLARCVRFVNGDCGDLPQVIKGVVERATAFCLDHHLQVHSLSQFGISNLKELKFCVVRECPNFRVFAANKKKKTEAIMPNLEFLGIHYLWKLQCIWSSVNMAKGSFNALKYLTVYTCPRLKFILPASIFTCLISLEELLVVDCEAVAKITEGKVKNNVMNNTTALPLLRKVELRNLLRLVSLGNGICATRTEIIVVGCPSFNQNVKPENFRPSLCCVNLRR